MIVFDAREAFLLRGGHDVAVNNKTSGRVVIERRYSENADH
jgi:hypothetical protein